MWWVLAILLVLSPAILYGLLLSFIAIYREKCPACEKWGLKCVTFIVATILVDGKRAPDSWGYYDCPNCGGKFKWHRGEWTHVSDKEIQTYESNQT
jgi:hypothetical protein